MHTEFAASAALIRTKMKRLPNRSVRRDSGLSLHLSIKRFLQTSVFQQHQDEWAQVAANSCYRENGGSAGRQEYFTRSCIIP